MAKDYRVQIIASSVLMMIGVLALAPFADIVEEPTYSGVLAVCGGLALIVGGIWSFRLIELQNDYDERFLQIGLRSAAFSFWTLFWGLYAWSQLEDNTAVAIPVFDPNTVLAAVTAVVFVLTYMYYNRVM